MYILLGVPIGVGANFSVGAKAIFPAKYFVSAGKKLFI